MSITQTITALPTAPSRQDPTNFVSEGDAFLAAMEGIPAEVNTWGGQANTLATAANSAQTGAELAETHAETAETNAEASATAATATANATIYAVGTTYAAGDVVLDPGNSYQAYTSQQTANTGNTPNTDDGTWWEPPGIATVAQMTKLDNVTALADISYTALAVADLSDTATPSVLTTAETTNKLISNYKSSGADHVFTMCAAHTKGNIIFIIGDEFQVDIEPDGSDLFYLNGTAMAADEHIVNSADTLGQTIVGMCANINGTLRWMFNSSDADWVEATP